MPRPDSTAMDLPSYANKPITALQKSFADWVIEKTGYDPQNAKTKRDAYYDGIRLGAQLRMAHQASPENQAARAKRKEEVLNANTEKAAAKPAPRAEETAPARKQRVTKPKAAAPTPAPEPVVETPKPRQRRAPAKANAAAAPF
jgi:hypothetical protein